MRYQGGWKVIVGLLFVCVVAWVGAERQVRAQEGNNGTGGGSGGLPPKVVDEAFFAGFATAPTGMTSNSFSLALGGETFNFIFTDEGDDWGSNGFSHESTFGEGNSGSIKLGSAVSNLSTTERVIIVREDGADFVLHSLFVNNRDGLAVTVAGFNNGAQAGSAQMVGSGSAATLNFSGLVVDEVRLTALHFENTNIDSFAGDTSATVDYGDLPQSYGLTTAVDNGARHALGAVYLGNCVDADVDGQPSALADGDDTDGAGETVGVCASSHADEEGVAPGSSWQDGVEGGSLQVQVTGGAGCLSGWIDWDSDDAFSGAGEQVLDMGPVSSGPNALTFDIPAGVFSGNDPEPAFYARFRLSADTGESGNCADDAVLQLDGAGGVGEVEDYFWSFSPTAVEVSSIAVSEKSGPDILRLALLGLLLSGVTSAVVSGRLTLPGRRWRSKTQPDVGHGKRNFE